MRPGPDAVTPLALLDVESLSDTGQVDALIALDRQIAWLQARQQRLIASFTTRAATEDTRLAALSAARGGPARSADPAGLNFAREDVACALRIAGSTAQDRLDVAAQLTGRLADTLALLEGGRISYWHARILATAVEILDDAATAQVQARVLPRAPEQTPGEFRASVRRAVAHIDRRRQEQRHAEAVAMRHVAHRPADDGMADIVMHLAADGAAAIMAAVNALASVTSSDDARTLDQRRADAAVDLACSALRAADLPTHHGARPSIQVTVALSKLLGEDDQPGELAGYGPIPAGMARRISTDQSGTWRRLITDPAGRLLDYAQTTYEPPADLTRHVIARDQHCVMPGCRRTAWRCELDHGTPYNAGGHTSADNLAPLLCKRHHMLRHHTAWTLTRLPDGAYQWRTRTGHRHRYRPPPHPTSAADGDAWAADRVTRAECPGGTDPPPF